MPDEIGDRDLVLSGMRYTRDLLHKQRDTTDVFFSPLTTISFTHASASWETS